MAAAEVFGSGRVPGITHSARIVTPYALELSSIRLPLKSGRVYLRLRVVIDYRIDEISDNPRSERFIVDELRYAYRVSNFVDEELFVYHFHPESESVIHHPHLHMIAPPFDLPQHPSGQPSVKLPISKAHFPTGHVTLQQVIRLLIEDFGVETRVPNWREVLGEPDGS